MISHHISPREAETIWGMDPTYDLPREVEEDEYEEILLLNSLEEKTEVEEEDEFDDGDPLNKEDEESDDWDDDEDDDWFDELDDEMDEEDGA